MFEDFHMLVEKRFLGAFKMGHLKKVREFIDQEYAYDLLKKANKGCQRSLEALLFLTKFNNEYYKARGIRRDDPETLHKSDDLRKDCFDRNNHAQAAVEYLAIRVNDDPFQFMRRYLSEDELIMMIDFFRAYRTEDPEF